VPSYESYLYFTFLASAACRRGGALRTALSELVKPTVLFSMPSAIKYLDIDIDMADIPNINSDLYGARSPS